MIEKLKFNKKKTELKKGIKQPGIKILVQLLLGRRPSKRWNFGQGFCGAKPRKKLASKDCSHYKPFHPHIMNGHYNL